MAAGALPGFFPPPAARRPQVPPPPSSCSIIHHLIILAHKRVASDALHAPDVVGLTAPCRAAWLSPPAAAASSGAAAAGGIVAGGSRCSKLGCGVPAAPSAEPAPSCGRETTLPLTLSCPFQLDPIIPCVLFLLLFQVGALAPSRAPLGRPGTLRPRP